MNTLPHHRHLDPILEDAIGGDLDVIARGRPRQRERVRGDLGREDARALGPGRGAAVLGAQGGARIGLGDISGRVAGPDGEGVG